MRKEQLDKISNLLEDTFIFIDETRVIENFFVVSFIDQYSEMNAIHETIPENDSDVDMCLLLLKLQKKLTSGGHPAYFKVKEQ
jgi:hypothetical protein